MEGETSIDQWVGPGPDGSCDAVGDAKPKMDIWDISGGSCAGDVIVSVFQSETEVYGGRTLEQPSMGSPVLDMLYLFC